MSSTFFTNPRTNPELRSLYEIVLLPPQDSLQHYFASVMATLSEYFSIRYSSLLLSDPQEESLRVEALYGMEKEIHPLACPSRKGMIGNVLESRRPVAIHNLNQ